MTSLPPLRTLILAAAAVASPMLASSLPAAAAGQGTRIATGLKAPFVKISRSAASSGTTPTRDHRDRIIRDHRGVERTHPRAKPKPICAGWAC